MTPIEEAVPVSDPVAEAVGRLTEAMAEPFEAILPEHEVIDGRDTVLIAWARVDDLRPVLDALAKAGERIAELEKDKNRIIEESVETERALLVETARRQTADAQLAEARRDTAAWKKRVADAWQEGWDAGDDQQNPYASQPVPDPTLEVAK